MTLDRLKTLVDRRSWLYQKLPAAAYFGRPGAPATEYGDAIVYRLKVLRRGEQCYYVCRTDDPDVPEVVILGVLMEQMEDIILDN